MSQAARDLDRPGAAAPHRARGAASRARSSAARACSGRPSDSCARASAASSRRRRAGSGPAPPPPAPAPPPPKEYATNPALADIHFDFDKANIRPADAKILDASAAWLKSNPDQIVLIEGNCDERGTVEYNLALGERRAKSAMDYLVARGIAPNRITLISYGKERPVCTEKTEACYARNRRDHFLVKPR